MVEGITKEEREAVLGPDKPLPARFHSAPDWRDLEETFPYKIARAYEAALSASEARVTALREALDGLFEEAKGMPATACQECGIACTEAWHGVRKAYEETAQ